MPLFLSMFWGAAAYAMKSMVGRVLVALGISYVTYKGLDVLITNTKSDALAMLGNVPPQIIGAVGMLRLGEAISVIFSAITARYAMQALNGGITKMVTK